MNEGDTEIESPIQRLAGNDWGFNTIKYQLREHSVWEIAMILFWFNSFRKYCFIGLGHFISNLSKNAFILQNEGCSILWTECIPLKVAMLKP